MIEQWAIVFATGNLISDVGIAFFALLVYFHSKKKEKCHAERERITYQTSEKLRFLEEHRKVEIDAYTANIRSLTNARGRIPPDEWNEKWNIVQQRYDELRQELNNQESKIQWEEGNFISDLQAKYFPLFRRYKICFRIVIGLFFIGIMIQLYALSSVPDFDYMFGYFDVVCHYANISRYVPSI